MDNQTQDLTYGLRSAGNRPDPEHEWVYTLEVRLPGEFNDWTAIDLSGDAWGRIVDGSDNASDWLRPVLDEVRRRKRAREPLTWPVR